VVPVPETATVLQAVVEPVMLKSAFVRPVTGSLKTKLKFTEFALVRLVAAENVVALGGIA
jgi:hypothetical protein